MLNRAREIEGHKKDKHRVIERQGESKRDIERESGYTIIGEAKYGYRYKKGVCV